MKKLIALGLVLCLSTLAAAETVLTPDADAQLEPIYGDYHGDRNYGGSGSVQTRYTFDWGYRLGYFRYDLSAMDQDVASATWNLYSDNTPATVDIYGLNDGVAAGYENPAGYPRLGEDWQEGVGSGWNVLTTDSSGEDDPGNSDTSNDTWITANNAPGGLSVHRTDDAASQWEWVADDTRTTLLMDNAPVTIGEDNLRSIVLSQDVIDFLNADTNDMVTLILDHPEDAEGGGTKFYPSSKEGGSPAELVLVPVPEPATMGLLTLGGLALIRRRRKA